MKKVIFISSGGGHLSELLKLKPLFTKYKSKLITEKSETTKSLQLDIPIQYLIFGTRKHIVSYTFKFAINCLLSFWYFITFRPNVIVTTGAHSAVPMVYIAKLFRKKIVFIESCARVHSQSMTGKIIEKKCDKIIVQWPEMKKVYKNAEYHGTIL
ncbi:PssD/Cps14F family polysaccharide biosynthesis glycosyltransferase [Culicoidibacter larvae]|uniref:Polysaccharide biosynthesis protein n=1 Tax=Culicoidibacter larvae TaxID=2579976 RepID=A0A5R8QDB9_9FIRM|nr:PssD/Cps14F family polysaccharide biosynthesis glycosyltransferase [Culicoidibacter larvae]TLG75257.1 polysaccharide biosynthesis protein [Culicoidibacter larvae]